MSSVFPSSLTVPERNVYARSLVWRMFRDSADEDYLVARWSALNDLYFQFYWSAQQALEKYFKCFLLLNNLSVTRFSHPLLPMYDCVKQQAGDLIPDLMCRPNYFPATTGWFGQFPQPTRDFVEHVQNEGDPSNRYRHYGVVFHSVDLHKIDELCFRIRRICFPLDKEFIPGGVRYREHLKTHWNSLVHGGFSFDRRARKLAEAGQADIENTIRSKNFSFFENEALKQGKTHTGLAHVTSEIHSASERGAEGAEAIEWLVSNARFSKDDLLQIKSLLEGDVQDGAV